MTWTITEEWLDEHGVDIDAFMEALEAAGFDSMPGDNGWTFTAADDNHDNIPDFLADLITDPIITNVSQGGALG